MISLASFPLANSIMGMYADTDEVITTRLTVDDAAAADSRLRVISTDGRK